MAQIEFRPRSKLPARLVNVAETGDVGVPIVADAAEMVTVAREVPAQGKREIAETHLRVHQRERAKRGDRIQELDAGAVEGIELEAVIRAACCCRL